MNRFTSAFVLIAFLAAASTANGQFGVRNKPKPAGPADSREVVNVSVHAMSDTVSPGGDVAIAIVFDIVDHSTNAAGEDTGAWHIWANDADLDDNFFKAGFDIKASPEGVVNLNREHTQWPKSHAIDGTVALLPGKISAYEGRAIAYLPITIKQDAEPGTVTLTFTLHQFQACNDEVCMMPSPKADEDPDYKFEITLNIVELGAAAGGETVDEVFSKFNLEVWEEIRSGVKAEEVLEFPLFGLTIEIDVSSQFGFILLLLAAAVGGFLLNLTPCVLPVIPLKIMSLSQAAHGSRGRTMALGLSTSLGVVFLWETIGALIAFVKSFTAINQLFQYPAFTIGVGVFIAIMAVGMCGLFAVRLPQWVYKINPKQDSLHGSFGFGIMTGILSLPCTAPFMGVAAAWAATKQPPTILTVFGFIGLGMALPYFVLSVNPKLVEKMPRTAPASELIKQAMGLLMLAAAAFFIGAGLSGQMVSPPDPPSIAYWWVVAAFGAAAGLWLLVRTVRITKSAKKRVIFGGLGALIITISAFLGVRLTDPGPIDWTYYTPDRFTQAMSNNKVVVMEFTAEWCLNCKALEKTVLHQQRIADILNDNDGVEPIKVDITGNNEDGNDMLARVGRKTIPLLVVFAPDGSEVFKSDAYTASQVVEAVEKAKSLAVASR